MPIEHFTPRCLCLVFAAALAWPAAAQTTSGSASGSAPGSAANASTPVAAKAAGGVGAGPGVHGPGSPIAPLQERSDVLSWQLLTQATSRVEKTRTVPTFPAGVQLLNLKIQRVQGFMMPLEPGEKQRHFLLSSVPTSCSFCVPGGPESMIEVKTKTPVRYSLDAVVIEGQFAVLADDPYGLFYRLTDAVVVK